MAFGSLRSRLIFGSALWIAGVLAISAAIATSIVHMHPRWAGMLHNAMLVLFAFGCAVAGLSQIRRGLSPFNQLRERLGAVRGGREARVEGSYPTEVQPLVNDLNALLEDREASIARAVSKAGDLAHGLKTPLALIASDADRCAAAGHEDLAESIRQQVRRMQRQIEYHLAHARAAASGSAHGIRSSVARSAEGLARTLERLYADRGITIDVQVPPEAIVRVPAQDLDELLGNLLDNACKWARACVSVGTSADATYTIITIDDDGPGLAPDLRERVLQRGVRADEAAPGSGFGLAIVRDIAELYGGTIALHRSARGGVRAQLSLPGAATE